MLFCWFDEEELPLLTGCLSEGRDRGRYAGCVDCITPDLCDALRSSSFFAVEDEEATATCSCCTTFWPLLTLLKFFWPSRESDVAGAGFEPGFALPGVLCCFLTAPTLELPVCCRVIPVLDSEPRWTPPPVDYWFVGAAGRGATACCSRFMTTLSRWRTCPVKS